MPFFWQLFLYFITKYTHEILQPGFIESTGIATIRVQISNISTSEDKTNQRKKRVMALDFLYKLHIFAAKVYVNKRSIYVFFGSKLLVFSAFIYVSVQSISLEMICSLVHPIIFFCVVFRCFAACHSLNYHSNLYFDGVL